MLKWIIVEFEAQEGGRKRCYSLVNERSLLAGVGNVELHTGKVVSLRRGFKSQKAHIVMVSEDRRFLEEQLKVMEQHPRTILNAHLAAAENQNSSRSQYQGCTLAAAADPRHPADPRRVSTVATHEILEAGPSGQELYVGPAGQSGVQEPREGAAELDSAEEDSGSSSDWRPNAAHSSSESERECEPPRKVKQETRQYSNPKSSKPRPSLRAELSHPMNNDRPLSRNNSLAHGRRMSTKPNAPHRFSMEATPFYSVEMTSASAHSSNFLEPRVPMTFDQQSQTDNSGNTMEYVLAEIRRIHQRLADQENSIAFLRSCISNHHYPSQQHYDINSPSPPDQPSSRHLPGIRSSYGTTCSTDNHTPKNNYGGSPILTEANADQQRGNKRGYNRWSSHEEREKSHSNGSDHDDRDMVPIGSGKTLVPRHIYSQIDWNSHTIATRKLLMAIFPRKTLATHSLTGKSSPAFMSKPAKLRLDMKKVSDIVMTVVQNCNVKEGLVRSCITTKCADENKMYHMRLKKKAKKKKLAEEAADRENTPPHSDHA